MTSCDGIVVGGGVVGAAAAYYLMCAGLRTILLDAGEPGWATGAGAGILSAATDTSDRDPYQRFSACAAAHYPQLIEQLAEDGAGETGYGVCGSLTVAIDDQDAARLARIAATVGRSGGGCASISAAKARDLFPPLGPTRCAIHCDRGARVDGRLLAGALRRAALRRGLELREAAVERLHIAGDGVVISAGGEAIAARHLVLAAGAWSRTLGEQIGAKIPVEPQRGQIIHLDLPGADTRGWPIVKGLREHYIVPWPDGRVVVGATRETGSGCGAHTTVAGIKAVLAEALRVAPGLGAASIREIRVGLRPASADGRPLLGHLPGLPQVLVATGHGAVGLQQGPYSGKVIADLITGGAAETDISIFDPARFS